MATPKTIALPWRENGRGSVLLTSSRLQGVEATRQLIALSVLPLGATKNPWLQGKGMSERIIFDRSDRGDVDILARLVEIFARHRAVGRARLVQSTVRLERVEGVPGKRILSFTYEDLRRKTMVPVKLEVGE